MDSTSRSTRAPGPSGTRALARILAAGIALTIVHYTDNYLYFEEYPQPASLRRWQVWAAWILLTAIGLAGYRLYRRGLVAPACVCLVVYAYTGTSSLGHYLYGALGEFSVKQHVFILVDGLTGLSVLGFVAWAIFFARRGSTALGAGTG